MTSPERYMLITLAIAGTLIIFNIIAVTNGTADIYYQQIEQFIVSLFTTA